MSDSLQHSGNGEKSIQEKDRFSYLFSGNAPYIEDLYEQFLQEPAAVPETWRKYFESIQFQNGFKAQEPSHARIISEIRETARRHSPWTRTSSGMGRVEDSERSARQAAVLRLVQGYRLLGYLKADVDPIHLRPKPPVPEIDLYYQGLSDKDLDTVFNTSFSSGATEAPLREIIETLQQTYTGRIGVEFMHINNTEQRQWVANRIERNRTKAKFPPEFKRFLLQRLVAAEGLEKYLHTRYAGQKRFSLEGGDSLIPLMDAIIQRFSEHGGGEVVTGMAHRGRLNVLVNIMGKKPSDLFRDFEGKKKPFGPQYGESGDVKYHQGFSSDVRVGEQPMHLALAFNPSHLEIVNPVIQGSVRARQDRQGGNRRRVMAVLIHGDAALAGQGVIYESLNQSQTRGFTIGGTVHVVVNNQIGFTTSHPLDSRSTLFCTDIAKVIQAPILHVNGDDPEAVAYAVQLAVDYRMAFARDVFIDLICFRRWGHNEADEPSATQPMMYEKIRAHPGSMAVYRDRLVEEGVITLDEAEQMVEDYRSSLEAQNAVHVYPEAPKLYSYAAEWSPFLQGRWDEEFATGVSISEISRISSSLLRIPEDIKMHDRVRKVMEDRVKMSAGALPVDWGCAETLAYATLLYQGYAVRLTGQDSGRGTFFHRHAVVHNQNDGSSYVPLANLFDGQPRFNVTDSILSEEAVLGFEYGYSTTNPKTLVIWEAQYGDFANVAQVVIDQFISSSEQKWNRLSGLVLMLPHGWEGQGPEHSSARLERFMQLCADENIQVCAPTSPAQMFHLLRRQMLREFRKPLVIMSPKSMLRRKISFSPLDSLTRKSFRLVIREKDDLDPDGVKRVVLCSGKVYYDLLERRREKEQVDTAILRVEQLYPFPKEILARRIRQYTRATEVVWAQEEPMNQGAWYSIIHFIRACMPGHMGLSYAGRLSSASPAGGDHSKHVERQTRLVEAALNTGRKGDRPIAFFEPKTCPEETKE